MAKTKALISFAVTAKLICVFVFAYAKHWFSHDAAQMVSHDKPSTYFDSIHFTLYVNATSNGAETPSRLTGDCSFVDTLA